MELLKLLLVALAGVGAIGLLLYWTDTFKDMVIADVPEVHRRLHDDLPDFHVSEIILSADRKTAMAAESTGSRIALVYCAGDKLTTRELNADDLTGSMLFGGIGEKPLTLRVEVSDFALPGFDIVLFAPPSFALCLCTESGSENDMVNETDSARTARDIGKTWIDRIRKITDVGTRPPAKTA